MKHHPQDSAKTRAATTQQQEPSSHNSTPPQPTLRDQQPVSQPQPSSQPQSQSQPQSRDSTSPMDADGTTTSSMITEQDEAIVNRIEDSLYQDYSRVTPQDVAAGTMDVRSSSSTSDAYSSPFFPTKLHEMLSDPEADGLVTWLPHGRAWKILDANRFGTSALLSRHFCHGNFRSFMRQVSGWGFRRVERGRDEGAYYHQLFLRGMTHLCSRMSRTAIKTRRGERRSFYHQLRGVTPDFYRISEQFPLPSPAESSTSLLTPSTVPSSSSNASFAAIPAPDETMSTSSSSASFAAAAAIPDRTVSSSSSNASFRSIPAPDETVSSSNASFAAIPAPGETVSSSSSSSASFAAIAEAARRYTSRPDSVVSSSNNIRNNNIIAAPDSPRSVTSRSILAPQHRLPFLPPPAHSDSEFSLESLLMRTPSYASSLSSGSSSMRSDSSSLAQAALRRYIDRNTSIHAAASSSTANASWASLSSPAASNINGGAASVSGGRGGNLSPLTLARRNEVFLQRLRERADLIESLRSIVHG